MTTSVGPAGLALGSTAAQYIQLALQLAPVLIQAGLETYALAEKVLAALRKDGGPTMIDIGELAQQRHDILATLAKQAGEGGPVVVEVPNEEDTPV